MSTFQTLTKILVGLSHRILIAPDTGGLEGYTQVSDIVNVVAANHNHDASYAATTHNHDASYAAVVHDHAEFLTQAEIEALPGFGGGGGGGAIVGEVRMYGLSGQLPTGWLYCDGSPTTVGRPLRTAGILNTPDFRGRVPLGVGPDYALGGTGGSSSKTLQGGENGQHGGHATGFAWVASGGTYYALISNPPGSVGNSGSGSAFSTLPPYLVVNFIIYEGV